MESLKNEMVANYRDKIANLEEQLQNARPSAEQSMLIEQISCQLREIETSLDRKTKNLESLHSAIYSASCSSPSEDVSVKGLISTINSPVDVSFQCELLRDVSTEEIFQNYRHREHHILCQSMMFNGS